MGLQRPQLAPGVNELKKRMLVVETLTELARLWTSWVKSRVSDEQLIAEIRCVLVNFDKKMLKLKLS